MFIGDIWGIVWDRRDGPSDIPMTPRDFSQLRGLGWTKHFAERYAFALDDTIGNGLKQRIAKSVN